MGSSIAYFFFFYGDISLIRRLNVEILEKSGQWFKITAMTIYVMIVDKKVTCRCSPTG